MVAALCLLSVISFVGWRQELAEIRRMVATEIDAEGPPEQVISQARAFIRDNVGYGRHDAHFLLPVFSFMRPTALQVIRDGGDCAYRTRAFIVILRQYGIKARKLALYDPDGYPAHAVAKVVVDGEPRYYDMLFNLAHERADGTPLSLAELADDRVLRASIQRAIDQGNDQALRYPLRAYSFGDVRTLNWDRNTFTKLGYAGLRAVLGEERASTLPRPYLSEEPALMVIVLASGATGAILVVIVLIRVREPAPRRRRRPVRAAAGRAE